MDPDTALEPTLVLTFDNLGEASDLERGRRPAGEPLGRHPSVHMALPRLLEALDAHGLRATFFVEAINCELYPDALRQIAARGHELGMHGWRHEAWSALHPDEERETLERGLRAFADLGLEVHGFRPPGGELTPFTPPLLHRLGFRWCSPVGDRPDVRDGIAFVPFRWELVDAYHLMEAFSERRGSGPRSAAATEEILTRALTEGGARAVPQTLILHPFLMLDPAWWSGVQRILELVASQVRAGGLRVGPGGDLAESLLRGRVDGG